jgi:hypothetical protein
VTTAVLSRSRTPLLNRLRNSYDKTANIAPFETDFSLLERCPVTDSQHKINQVSAVSAHSKPLATGNSLLHSHRVLHSKA